MAKTCILIMDADHHLTPEALAYCRGHFDVVHSFDENDPNISAPSFAERPRDLLISFLNERILPERLLSGPNINFHPGPHTHPGRGGASLAIYEGATSYGATAHRMASTVDSGEILLTAEFEITQYDSCETLFGKAERACLDLLEKALVHFSKNGTLPQPSGKKWSRKGTTRKQFEQWLIIDNECSREMFDRKVAATYHSRFPGPYIVIHGLKFGLIKNQDALARFLQAKARR